MLAIAIAAIGACGPASSGGGPPPPGGPAPGAMPMGPGEELPPEPPPPEPEAEPPPAPPERPSSKLRGEAQDFLDLHNKYRAAHCAPPLAWSDALAKVAQKWADKLRSQGCAFGHSGTRYGENLAAGTSSALSTDEVVTMWYREVDGYNFRRGGFSMDTGHFTQLVWVDTRRVGCGRTTCKGMDIVVCNYDPPGNVQTMYGRNVLPTSCKRGK